jgi:hypothetical protein
VHRIQPEPKLLDILADPVTQAVMDADRVNLRALIAMLSEISCGLTRQPDASIGPHQVRFQAYPRREP